MRLSDKRKSALYSAISDAIMDQRLEYCKAAMPTADELDSQLFHLERKIWQNVKAVLKLDPQPQVDEGGEK